MRLISATVFALLQLSSRLPAQTAQPSPVGNYHAHLVSESSAKLLVVPPLPSVELPPELDRVMREFERVTRAADADAFAALFTDEGMLSQPTGWVNGRAAIRAAAGNIPPAELQVRAHQIAVADSLATITGSLSNALVNPARDVAKVTFTLRRSAVGAWLIASFLRENRPPPTPSSGAPFTAVQLIAQLDSARIQKALVLSVAYWFGSSLMPGAEKLPIADEYAKVRAENDWVATESAKYPKRLIAYCSFHPLKSYALDEIARCGKHEGIHGIKLHLANSGIDFRKSDDVQQLRRVFKAANEQRLPIVVHLRPRLRPYGKEDVGIFLREVLAEAPDIPIQIAHLAGWGSYDDPADEAAAAFVDAITRKDPATKNLSFDITTIVFPGQSAELRQRIAQRIRGLGVRRVVYGSDLADPARGWADILRLIPLTKAELATIARNVTPLLSVQR